MTASPGPTEGPLRYSHGVKRLADKKYRIVYDVPPNTGRPRMQKRETLIGKTRKEANAIRAKRIEEVAEGRYVKDDDMTLSELFDRFMAQKKLAGLEVTTLLRYQNLFNCHLIPAFGKKKVKELKQSHLATQYAKWLREGSDSRTLSARTVRHVHETLRNSLNYAVRMEYVDRNVAALVSSDDLPKAIKPKPKALTELELAKLLAEAKSPSNRSKKRGYLSAQPWFYAAVFFAAYTGCRRGEVLALRWSDVSFENKTVTIARSLTEQLTFKAPKNDKTRTLSMPEALMAVLRDHKAAQAEERHLLGEAYSNGDLVFAKPDGSANDPWNFGSAVQDCIKRAKVSPITLHGLRDTHASLLAKAGVPLEVVSKRLGHSNISITAERYLDVYIDRDAAAATAFESLVG